MAFSARRWSLDDESESSACSSSAEVSPTTTPASVPHKRSRTSVFFPHGKNKNKHRRRRDDSDEEIVTRHSDDLSWRQSREIRPLSSSNLAESRFPVSEASLAGAIAACKRQREDASSQIEAYRARLAALEQQEEKTDEPYSSFPALVAFDRRKPDGIYYDLLQVSSSASRSSALLEKHAFVDADPCAALVYQHKEATSSAVQREKALLSPTTSKRAVLPTAKSPSIGSGTTTPTSSPKRKSDFASWLVACVARRRTRRIVRFVAVVAMAFLALGSFLVFCSTSMDLADGWLSPWLLWTFHRPQHKATVTVDPSFAATSSAVSRPRATTRRTVRQDSDLWEPTEARVAVVSSNFGKADVLGTAPRQRGTRRVSFFLFTRHRDFLAALRGWTLVLPSSMETTLRPSVRGNHHKKQRRRRVLASSSSSKKPTRFDVVAPNSTSRGRLRRSVHNARFVQQGEEVARAAAAAFRAALHPTKKKKTHEIEASSGKEPSVVYSESWDAALERINVGKRRMNIAQGVYPPSSRRLVDLPFDLESLEHTRHYGIGREYDEAQNLIDVMAPKFVKLQMFRIDVLLPYTYLVWADASLVFDDSAVNRAMRPLLKHDADLVVQPHPKRNSTFQELTHILEVQSQDRFVPIAPYLRAQREHYSNMTNFDDAHGLYWMAYFGARRSNKTTDFFDRWWLEVRRWQYRDQVSVMFALESMPKHLRPKVTTFDVDGHCCKAPNGKKLPPEQVLCVTLVGDVRKCCRRCMKKIAHETRKLDLAFVNSTNPDEDHLNTHHTHT